jgi:hypothetical protein
MKMRKLPPVWMLRPLLALYRLVLGVLARLPGGTYCRFVILPDWCKRAVDRGECGRAVALAQELLLLASRYPSDWNFGNAVHHAHLVLGRVALATNNLEEARAQLIAAGETPGSPQLNSFGPNMRLAQDLLRHGDRDAVLVYFDLCRRFWELGKDRLAEWTAAVGQGQEPNFGPNVSY